MKYLITMELKEPFAENWQRILALEEERMRKGVHLGIGGGVKLPVHFTLKSPPSIVLVAETDNEHLVMKHLFDYTPFVKVESVPIIQCAEYVKRMGI